MQHGSDPMTGRKYRENTGSAVCLLPPVPGVSQEWRAVQGPGGKGLRDLPCACQPTGIGLAQRAGAEGGTSGSGGVDAQKGPFTLRNGGLIHEFQWDSGDFGGDGAGVDRWQD